MPYERPDVRLEARTWPQTPLPRLERLPSRPDRPRRSGRPADRQSDDSARANAPCRNAALPISPRRKLPTNFNTPYTAPQPFKDPTKIHGEVEYIYTSPYKRIAIACNEAITASALLVCKEYSDADTGYRRPPIHESIDKTDTRPFGYHHTRSRHRKRPVKARHQVGMIRQGCFRAPCGRGTIGSGSPIGRGKRLAARR